MHKNCSVIFQPIVDDITCMPWEGVQPFLSFFSNIHLSGKYSILRVTLIFLFLFASVSTLLNATGMEDVETGETIQDNGGNNTIGTITILEGNYTVSRYHRTSSRDSEDEILSGHIVTTVGRSIVHLRKVELKFFYTQFTGDIFVLLEDAKVSFTEMNEKIYLAFIRGIVTVYAENGGGNEKNVPSPVTINLAENDLLNWEFPGLDYYAVVELDLTTLEVSDEATYFFSVSFIEEYLITEEPEDSDNDLFFLEALESKVKTGLLVEVYDGEVEVKNERDSVIVQKYEKVIAEDFNTITHPTHVERLVVALKSNDPGRTNTVEGLFSANEINVNRIITTHNIPLIGKEVFIVDSALPGLTIEMNARKYGNYIVSFTSTEENLVKSFELSTSVSLTTTDTFVITANKLLLKNMELGKTFDLIISVEDITTGEIKEFRIEDVATSAGEMSFEIIDWEKLDDEEKKSVIVSRGEKGIKISAMTTGEEIEKEFRKAGEKEETNLWLLILIFSMFILALGVGLQRTIYSQNKRAVEVLKKSEGRVRQFFVSPEGIILDISDPILKILGYKKEELIGKPLKTMYAPELLLEMEQLFAKWRKTGDLNNEEMIIVTKGGDRCKVLLNASAMTM